jgi:mannan endo-1,4-beta-mannosidase
VKTRHLICAVVLIAIAVMEYAAVARVDIRQVLAVPAAALDGGGGAGPTPTPRPPAYDITPLLRPANKYLGVAIDGSPPKMAPIEAFADRVGKPPNLVTIYASFADGFAANEVRQVYAYGALAAIRWEPFNVKLADIAAGRQDDYITTFAAAIRKVNAPIVLTFGHEMNGDWYPWGRKNKAADFVAAWQHIYRLFAQVDATNVIWTWTPNVINPMPGVKLKPFYPGDAYVDWVGMDGYYTRKGQKTFRTLFEPTLDQVRAFTKKPVLIVETAAEPGDNRPDQIADLFGGVAKDPDLLGFVWFDNNGSGKWNIDKDPSSVKAFHQQAASDKFGFTVR